MEPTNEEKSTSKLSREIITPANLITITRILASPILFILILSADGENGASWKAFILGLIFGISDAFDGQIARATGSVTKLGAFLDPLADKVVVLGCMLSLLSIGRFHWLPVMIIFTREIGISIYRFWVVRKGVVIPASNLAKWKTFVQGVTLLVAVLPPIGDIDWLVIMMLWFAVAMTLITGWQYIQKGNEAFQNPPMGRS
ncbi:MAG: CDP-diacylglycerol--glycerol-3-phosphate 3-phosphatidyltransferase [Acidimicrobiales bacterium]|nr:CDP-diacylglycerol--glycerol-3-phosphate 3-phosphatidyltransferase [Acidimicrobiales bacterium]HJM27602.1 CDP-diacylglycerol--glycerol-3-phosphate 3-phosphatidyltransferase [Acidimicrobiales bacterium]